MYLSTTKMENRVFNIVEKRRCGSMAKDWNQIGQLEFPAEYVRFVENIERARVDPNMALEYATEFLRDRFQEGEKAILNSYLISRSHAVEYARTIIKGRWIEFEDLIANNLDTPHIAMAEIVLEYVNDVVKDRVKEFEPLLAKYGSTAFNYALLVIKGRFEEGEAAISQGGHLLYRYATEVLKGKLPPHLHRIMLANAIKES